MPTSGGTRPVSRAAASAAAGADDPDPLEAALIDLTATGSTDDLMRVALVKLLAGASDKKSKKKKNFGVPDHDSDSDQDWKGGNGSMSLERLKESMRRNPGVYADLLERRAAKVIEADIVATDGAIAVRYAAEALPIGRARTMGYFAWAISHIHKAVVAEESDRARLLCMSILSALEQQLLDESWETAWRIVDLAQPPFASWGARTDIAQLRRDVAHSRLVEPRWAAMVAAAIKDEETLVRRRGKGAGRGKGGEPAPGH